MIEYYILIGIIIIFGLYFFFSRNNRKYEVIYCQKENNVFNFVGRQALKELTDLVRYRKHTYKIDKDKPTYVNGLKTIYVIDISLNKTLKLKSLTDITKEMENPSNLNLSMEGLIDSEALDLIVNRNILSQISYGMKELITGFNLTSILLGFVIGILVGYLIGSSI